MEARLNNTELNNRILWYDGDSTVAESEITRLVSLGLPVEGMFVNNLTNDIKQYNRLVPKEQQITIKKTVCPLLYDWNIPEEYANMDLRTYLIQKLDNEISSGEWSENDIKKRAIRVSKELKLYETMNLVGVLRALIYIINTLQLNNIVWGVGRGSSVSSYVLYLIGVHDVDSVEYDLDITDFLRDE